MLVLVAILLAIVVILMVFVVNLAWMELSRTQTFIAADAATRAAGRTFSMTGDVGAAKVKANEIAKLNRVAGKPLTLVDSDFQLGSSNRSSGNTRYIFTPGGSNPNAMKVTINRSDASVNGSIPLLMPKALGIGSFSFSKSSVTTRVEVDIAFVIDRSGSMAFAANEAASAFHLPAAAPFGWNFGNSIPSPSRWRDLALAANGFISEMNASVLQENVALVTYGDSAVIDASLSNNYATIQTRINNYTNSYPPGATNIGDGLQLGINALASGAARDSASKVIILMTDGIRTAGPDPLPIAIQAATQGIVIFTVTFAAEADQPAMIAVAHAGSGQHFHATSAATLTAVFEIIVRMLPTVLTE